MLCQPPQLLQKWKKDHVRESKNKGKYLHHRETEPQGGVKVLKSMVSYRSERGNEGREAWPYQGKVAFSD